MNIWAKVVTALRGGVNEAGEAIVDSQALRILDQEIRDADDELKQAKDSLAGMMAKLKVGGEKIKQAKATIEEHEGYAVQALDKGDEALAMEVAEKIAELESQCAVELDLELGYKKTVEQMQASVKQATKNIKRLKQQTDSVKATASVQKAQAAVAERHSGADSRLRTALDSLERIKEKQSLNSAQIESAHEMAESEEGGGLQERLEKAGIRAADKTASDILERLKKK